MKFALQKLESLVDEHLGGDRARFSELFETKEIFVELRAQQNDSDWYHFSPQTFDGQYLVEASAGFLVYEQNRGVRTGERLFGTLKAAAIATFGETL